MPCFLQLAAFVEQYLVMLRKVGDAEKIRLAVSVEIDELVETVAANVRGRNIPREELLDFAGGRVKAPHLAVRFDHELVHAVAVEIGLIEAGEAGVLVEI